MQLSPRDLPESCILSAREAIQTGVNPLRLLVDVFVNTFGITPPTPETEVRAGRVIAAMLASVFILIGVAALLLRSALIR